MEDLTFDTYKNTYGGLAPEDYFKTVVGVAGAFVYSKTVISSRNANELVQKAVALYIDQSWLYDEDNATALEQSKKGIKSESVLSHSVSYQDANSMSYAKGRTTAVERVVLQRLLGTGLLNTSVRLV